MRPIKLARPEGDYEALLWKLASLKRENVKLRAQVEFLRGNPAITKGLRGEILVAELLGAEFAARGSGHDLVASGGQVRLEVKYSSLIEWTKRRRIKRWVWTKLFGELGKKQYARLILIGDVDPSFAHAYANPTAPYIMFDLPYGTAVDMVGGVQPGRQGKIELTTNPQTVRSWRAQSLFSEYQITIQELHRRYPKLVSYAARKT